MISFEDYVRHDGLGLAARVRSGELSPVELLDAAIARIERHNPALNAVIRTRYDAARREATQVDRSTPFAGVPFLVKDLVATIGGEPTANGNRLLTSLAMPRDSELVRRWRAAGVVIAGRSNTPEFGLTPYTEPITFGPTRNPWSAAHSPGGSSGGSAAAIAAGMVPLASGGDGGGSIRIPASCCGLFGFKPSRGATPTGPDFGELWHGFAIEHVLSRSVRDSAAMLDATAGADAGAPYAAPARGAPLSRRGRRRSATAAHRVHPPAAVRPRRRAPGLHRSPRGQRAAARVARPPRRGGGTAGRCGRPRARLRHRARGRDARRDRARRARSRPQAARRGFRARHLQPRAARQGDQCRRQRRRVTATATRGARDGAVLRALRRPDDADARRAARPDRQPAAEPRRSRR